ncbi:hypothetical protein ACLB2K_051960 [Fragaria x ananassa]
MCSLEQLSVTYSLSRYFPQLKITDIGGVAISGIQTLRELRLCPEGVLDATIAALAENCPKLEILDINDCHEP